MRNASEELEALGALRLDAEQLSIPALLHARTNLRRDEVPPTGVEEVREVQSFVEAVILPC
jgi:hypothetical protein